MRLGAGLAIGMRIYSIVICTGCNIGMKDTDHRIDDNKNMGWQINDQEFQAVLALPGEQRYSYFIKRVADWEQVWSLQDEKGWVLTDDAAGHELVPVWPHPRFAEACVAGAWAGSVPKAIELSEWLEYWIPGMINDQRLVAVFPTPSMTSVTVVTPERLRDDLEEELSLY
jgi:hypothetical protein